MAQSLELNIKTTSDVPQAMDKAKAATTSFGKQVQDIGRKFGTSFKDIFLSFVGPMALVTGAMATIGKMIADNERKRAEANQAAIDGTNELMSAEDKYWARKNEREKKTKETAEEAKAAREDVTLSFLQTDPRGKGMVDDILSKLPPGMRSSAAFNTANNMSRQKDIQDQVQKMLAEDLAKNPELNLEAVAAKKKAEEEAAKAKKNAEIKTPEIKASSINPSAVSGNVIGVGANPVIAAMQEQTQIAKEQRDYLAIIANRPVQHSFANITDKGATPSTPATGGNYSY
jgi:hypothetical protein